jgi:hypothetical protein
MINSFLIDFSLYPFLVCLPSLKTQGKTFPGTKPTPKSPLNDLALQSGLGPFDGPWLHRRTPLPAWAKEMVRKPHQYFRPADMESNQICTGHKLLVE